MEAPTGSWSLRDKIAIKRQLSLALEASQCTFQPSLSARPEHVTTEKLVVSRFDRLYDDAIKRKSEGPKVKVEVDRSTYTFKPTLYTKSRSPSIDREPSEFFESMHKASGAGRKKEIAEDQNLFKPTISKRANSLDRSMTFASKIARLLVSKQKHQDEMDKLKSEENMRIAEECTFSPVIYSSRSACQNKAANGNRTSVINRLLEFGEKKKARLEEEQRLKAIENLAEATFKPAVNKRGRYSFTSVEDDGTDVYSRLVDKKKETIVENDPNLTFQPKSRRSSILLNPSGESVHDRLYKEAEIKRKAFEEEVRAFKAIESARCTFSPQITRRTSSIVESASVDSEETTVFERLHGSRQSMQSILEQVKNDLDMIECTFQPKLYPSSRRPTRRISEGSVHERLDKDALVKRSDEERRVRERFDIELQGATFYPQFSSSSTLVRRKSILLDSPSGESGQSPAGSVHRRLSTAHTMSSTPATVDSSSTSSTPPVRPSGGNEKAMMDVEKLFAAGGKHSRSLHAWEQERTDQLTSSMSNHSISDNSNKSLRKSKKCKEDFPDDISINSAASSSYALKHGATQKRSTNTGKLSSSSIEKEPTSPSSVIRTMSQKDYPPTKNGPSGCDYSGNDLNFIPADVMSSQKMTIVAI